MDRSDTSLRSFAVLLILPLLVYQSILNSNLTVNILLKAFKSFIEKYSIVCTFMQTIHFQYSCNFSYANHFTINCLKSIKTNQYAFSYKSFQKFKSFCNHSNTLELEREKWGTNKKDCHPSIHVLGISTSTRAFSLVSP